MWVRGLKHAKHEGFNGETGVAPHVGAWIETVYGAHWAQKEFVAPHVGAWIETWGRWKYPRH